MVKGVRVDGGTGLVSPEEISGTFVGNGCLCSPDCLRLQVMPGEQSLGARAAGTHCGEQHTAGAAVTHSGHCFVYACSLRAMPVQPRVVASACSSTVEDARSLSNANSC